MPRKGQVLLDTAHQVELLYEQHKSTGCVKVPLSQGLFALIDAEDYELITTPLTKYCGGKHLLDRIRFGQVWSAAYDNYTFYATAKGEQRAPVKMHRLVIQAQKFELIDHKNRVGLDNRKANLRVVTHSESNQNRRNSRHAGTKDQVDRW